MQVAGLVPQLNTLCYTSCKRAGVCPVFEAWAAIAFAFSRALSLTALSFWRTKATVCCMARIGWLVEVGESDTLEGNAEPHPDAHAGMHLGKVQPKDWQLPAVLARSAMRARLALVCRRTCCNLYLILLWHAPPHVMAPSAVSTHDTAS